MSGPIWDGQADVALAAYVRDAVDQVAQQGLAEVHLILDRSIRNPTPYYETQIRIINAGTDRVVNDSDVIYGPWLEGVDSRNSTTRFKGYFAFRIATQMLQQRSKEIAENVLPPHLRRMGDGN